MRFLINYMTGFELSKIFYELLNKERNEELENYENTSQLTNVHDIFLIYDDKSGIVDILCDNIGTIYEIYQCGKKDKEFHELIKLYRCYIIKYNDIIDIMSYKEFYNRYNYKKWGV
ncbi:MAG: hypothetical protein ACLR60_08395 [Clostridium paraputrificum]